mgnify:CR=1 FL=1
MHKVEITQELLCKLTGREITLADRRQWPHESELCTVGNSGPSTLSNRKQKQRTQFINDILALHYATVPSVSAQKKSEIAAALAKQYCLHTTAYTVPYHVGILKNPGTHPEEFHLVGDKLPARPNQETICLKAIIVPTSPYLKEKDFWRLTSGINPEKVHPLDHAPATLHEVGHIVNYFSDTESNPPIRYTEELYAETWGYAMFLILGGSPAIAASYHHARATSAFLVQGTEYWLSQGLRAWANNKPQPAFEDVVLDTAALRAQIFFKDSPEMLPQILAHMNARKFRHRLQTTKKDMIPSFTEPNFVRRIRPATPERVFAHLADLITRRSVTKNISESMLITAEGALRGYEHFCPEAAKEVIHPRRPEHVDFGQRLRRFVKSATFAVLSKVV